VTPEEIEAMAREAGCFTPGAARNYWAVTDDGMARFAALVRARALGDAATLVQQYDTCGDRTQGWQDIFASNIRALP
jgi:hypothetical protein